MKVVKPAPQIFSIAIEFDLEEAQTLRTICGYIGGDTCSSLRRHTDALSAILDAAGVRTAEEQIDRKNSSRGSLFFKARYE